jgi:hypothetical protein
VVDGRRASPPSRAAPPPPPPPPPPPINAPNEYRAFSLADLKK